MTQQEKIDQAVKAKQKRYDQTSASILISWAINNAVQTIVHDMPEQHWDWAKEQIKERYQFFIELYKEWMAENGPEEDKTDEECEKFWSEVDQKNYNERSEISSINEELQAISGAKDMPF